MSNQVKILTVCRAGLVRSVALAGWLKRHYKPVEALTVGCGFYDEDPSDPGSYVFFNNAKTKQMLYDWADFIVVMETRFRKFIPFRHLGKTLICDVGDDFDHDPTNPVLVNKCKKWCEENAELLGIKEDKNIK